MNYYIAENGQQRGPYAIDQLAGQGLRADSMVWTEGMGQWLRADQVVALRPVLPASTSPDYGGPSAGSAAAPPPPGYVPGGYAVPGYGPPQPQYLSDASGKKLAAGICGIVVGHLGIHKFILGYTTAGLIMLLVTVLTCGIGGTVMWVIGIIEGIMYLTKSDEQFHQEYVARQKPWF